MDNYRENTGGTQHIAPISVEITTRKTLEGVRIARISTVPFFVVSQLKHQLEALGQSGANVMVVASDEPELRLLEEVDSVHCVAMDIPRSISPWRDAAALLRLFFFFKREQIQIAHSTTPKAGLLAALAAFAAGVPVRLHTFTGQPWLTMHGLKRWVARASDKLIGILNTRCYADSESQRQYMIAQRVGNAKRLFVIGSGSLAGVDLHRFDKRRFSSQQCEDMRRSLAIPSEAFVLLFVGRITADKGVRELLQAFEKLKIGAVVHLVFVGRFDANSGVTGTILPGDIACVQNTHIVGHTEIPEAYMAIADILCLPSYREGFGTVVIEAAAMGVPTIGTNIYGLSDAIIHGKTGLLVQPRHVEALLHALETLLTDHALRVHMGEAARYRAERLFDASEVNRLVVEEYCALLQKSGRW